MNRALLLAPLAVITVYLAARDGIFSPSRGAAPAAPAAPTPLPPGIHVVPTLSSAARVVAPHLLSVRYCVS